MKQLAVLPKSFRSNGLHQMHEIDHHQNIIRKPGFGYNGFVFSFWKFASFLIPSAISSFPRYSRLSPVRFAAKVKGKKILIPNSDVTLPMDNQTDINEKAQSIQLFAMDVDGVLTAGEVIYTEDGREIKVFNVKDGHGIALLLNSGVEVALITGRCSPITQQRANELGIRYVFQGIKSKLPVLEGLMAELGLEFSQVAYMGDDTPDIPIMQAVSLAFCPADALDEVKRVSHYTTQAPGGRGAVREVTDLLMRSRLLPGKTDASSAALRDLL